MDIRAYNRDAWDRQVAAGSRWTVPVDAETIRRARDDVWQVALTADLPVPRDWFPPLAGCDLLCLAGAGGQQGPVLAAAGARVTVLDNAPAQLARDRAVAERDGLELTLIEGDMADLSALDTATFDLVFNPASCCFVPDVTPVWREAYRVLRPGGVLMSGQMNPVFYIFDADGLERGELKVRYSLPYADVDGLDPDQLRLRLDGGDPLEFSHTLDTLVGGQLAAGFALTGFYEDRFHASMDDAASACMPVMFATRAIKPEQ